MSTVGGIASNRMMKAIVMHKTAIDQQAQMKARVIKLQREREKALKHIKDMQRKQKFMEDMHDEKVERRKMCDSNRQMQKWKEDTDRDQFNLFRKTTNYNIGK